MASSHRLPEEIVQPANGRRVAFHVLGTLAVILALNWAAWAYMQRVPLSHDTSMAHTKWSLLRERGAEVDTLIVGDSSGNFGVMPEVLGDEIGWNSINVCTMGRYLAVGDVWMVRDAIERFGAPKRVVSVHAVRRWEDQLAPQSIAQVPLPFGFWNHQPDLELGLAETRDLLVARYIPLYAANLSLARALRSGEWSLTTPIQISPLGHASLPDASPLNVRRKSNQTRKDFAGRKELKLTPHNIAAMEALRDLADEHDFDLYLAHGPVFKGLAGDPVYQAYLQKLQGWLRELAATSDRVHIVFEQPLTFPIDQMENPNHLVGPFPAGYTRSLAQALSALAD